MSQSGSRRALGVSTIFTPEVSSSRRLSVTRRELAHADLPTSVGDALESGVEKRGPGSE